MILPLDNHQYISQKLLFIQIHFIIFYLSKEANLIFKKFHYIIFCQFKVEFISEIKT